MKGFMILCFGVGALWDGLTTALGLAVIIQADDELGYAMCFVGGIIVLGFGIGTKLIFESGGFVYLIMKVLWLIAIIFDFYTAFIGNAQYIILKVRLLDISRATASLANVTHSINSAQFVVLIVLTVLVSASPILISYLQGD